MNSLKKGVLVGLMLLLVTPWLSAQIELEATSNNGIKRVVCGEEDVFFFDDNTIDGILYTDEEARNDSIVLCSEGSISPLTLFFHEFSIANGDNLEVYNGDITSSSPSLINNFSGHGVSATGGWTASTCGSSNPSGCISFIFRTNGDKIKSTGWKAKVVCDPADIKIQCVGDKTVQHSCTDSPSLVPVSFKVPTFTSTSSCGGTTQLKVALSTCATATIPSEAQSGQTISGKFPIGEHEVTAHLPGNTAINCSFKITVTAASFSCNNRVPAKMDADCIAPLNLSELVKDDCYGAGISFDLSVKDKEGNTQSVSFTPNSSTSFNAAKWELSADLFDCSERYQVIVNRKVSYEDCEGKEKSYSASCHSTIWLEDRTPPSITAITRGTVNACTIWTDDLIKEKIDFTVQNACGVSISSVMVGEFRPSACGSGTIPVFIEAEDHCGNTGRKQINVNVQKPKKFVIATRKTLSCGASNHPSNAGYPYLDMDGDGRGDIELNQPFCDYEVTYQDETQFTCGDSYKIRRVWSIRDLCTRKPPTVLAPQIIETNSLTCNGACDDNGRLLTVDSSNVAMVSGKIITNPSALAEVQILAVGANGYEAVAQADDNGIFALPLPRYQDYVIKATKDTDRTMGVSILDIIATLRHIVGTQPFTTTRQMLAADLNQSGTITAMDAVNMRQLLLNEDDFNDYPTWRFIPSAVMEADQFPFQELNDYLQLSYVEEETLGLDFQAIKMGDVNGSFGNLQRAESRNQKSPLALMVPDWSLTAGDVVDIPLNIPTSTALNGLQFVLQLSGLEIISVKEGRVTAAQFYQTNNQELKVCWDEMSGHQLEEDHLLTLQVKATHTGNLADFLAIDVNKYDPIAVFDSEKTAPVSLSFHTSDLSVYNSPNPFQYQTTVVFELTSEETVLLNIYNVEGKLLYNKSYEGQKGQNQLILTKDMLSTSGLLFYELKTKDQVFSSKMLLK